MLLGKQGPGAKTEAEEVANYMTFKGLLRPNDTGSKFSLSTHGENYLKDILELQKKMAKAKAAADEASRLEAEEADFLASPDGAKWKKELDARRAAQLEADRLEAIKIRIAGKGTA